MKHKRKGAYFILEVALFLLTVAIIAAASTGNFGSILTESKVSTAQNEVMQLGSAVSHYRYDTGSYPDTLADLAKKGTGSYEGYGPRIPAIKKDPWGKDYKLQTGKNGFVIYCTENDTKTNSSADAVDSGMIGFHGL